MNLPKEYFMRIAKLAKTPLLLGLILYLGGCIPNKGYRTQLPAQAPDQLPTCSPAGGPTPPTCSIQIVRAATGDSPTPVEIPLAFIEFDDAGQAFKRGQIDAAEEMIHAQRKKYTSIITILFIHGWKNNASDESGNVAGFRRFLQQFQPTLGSNSIGLVGVYFGWRGGTTNVAVVKELTYWNRRDTATYIPGSNMSEALLRVARATKGSHYGGNSKLVVVGHSFGGLVLERTITQYLTRRMVENPSGNFNPFADLLVFVNEAAAATEAIQLLTMLKERYPTNRPLYPTIVSITSQGDLATKFVLPVGQGASLFKKSLRDYGPPYDTDPFGIAKQRTYYLRSATHIPQLQSHVVGNSPEIKAAYTQRHGYTCVSIPSADPKHPQYYVVPIKEAPNTTPYWIMQMPVEIVPDHSNIFRLEFGKLLQAFVLRQAQKDQKAIPDPDTCAPPAFDMSSMRNTFSVQ